MASDDTRSEMTSGYSGTSFRDRQRALKKTYKEEPGKAKQVSVVHSVTSENADTGTVCIAVDDADKVAFEIGAHHSVGGNPALACSGDAFLASLAACYEVTLRLVAAASKITVHRLDLRAEGDWDARGTLGMNPDVPVGFTAIRIVIDLDADGPADRLAQLGGLTEQYCVVSQTLKSPPKVEVSLERTERKPA